MVYGRPFGDYKKSTQYYEGSKRIIKENQGYYGNGEYRYHGYTAAGSEFTNQNFPDDHNSGRALTEKNWISTTWEKGLTDSPHLLNDVASAGHPGTQQWINDSVPFNIPGRSDKYNYALVLSPPSPYAASEVRMWQAIEKKSRTEYWYQTFSGSPKGKEPKPVNVSMELLNPPEELQYIKNNEAVKNTVVPVKVKLKARLLDDYEYGKEGKRHSGYFDRSCFCRIYPVSFVCVGGRACHYPTQSGYLELRVNEIAGWKNDKYYQKM